MLQRNSTLATTWNLPLLPWVQAHFLNRPPLFPLLLLGLVLSLGVQDLGGGLCFVQGLCCLSLLVLGFLLCLLLPFWFWGRSQWVQVQWVVLVLWVSVPPWVEGEGCWVRLVCCGVLLLILIFLRVSQVLPEVAELIWDRLSFLPRV